MDRNRSSIVAARGADVKRKGGHSRGKARGRRNANRADLFSGPGFNFQTGPRMARTRRAILEPLAFLTLHVQQQPIHFQVDMATVQELSLWFRNHRFRNVDSQFSKWGNQDRIIHASVPELMIPVPGTKEIDYSYLMIDRAKLRFLFKKQLGNTDVSSLKRIVLPKRDAESHLPILDAKQGISIAMLDIDGMHEWRFKFRYWPNNSSKMYLFEGTGDFADAHDLAPGDCILLYRNIEDGRYIIEAKKEEEFEPEAVLLNNLAINGANEMAFHEPAPPPTEVVFPEFCPLGLLEGLEDLVGYDATYDYEPAFLDDSPLVYQGDPIKLPHLDLNIPFEPFEDDYAGEF